MRGIARTNVNWGWLAPMLLFLAAPAQALVLTFDPVNRNFEHVSQSYGDRVSATPQDGFSYGTEDGFTPNVEVDYGLLHEAVPALWTAGYGDLVNVLFEDHDGIGLLEVTFTADPGWNVALHSFDMAAYSVVGPINSVSVRDGQGAILFAQNSVSVPVSGHATFSFDAALTGQVLILAFDSSNLGSQSDDVCFDNIRFSQFEAPVPVEPVTWGRIKALYR